jgi:hypothetical protein
VRLQIVCRRSFGVRKKLVIIMPCSASACPARVEMNLASLAPYASEAQHTHCVKYTHGFDYSLLEDKENAIVIQGLAAGLSPGLWSWKSFVELNGDNVYHKFKVFRNGVERGWRSMSVRNYDGYLKARK